MNSSTPSERIKPFYPVQSEIEETILFEPERAILTQKGKTFEGNARVIHDWSRMVAFLDFLTDYPSQIEFGECQIDSTSISTKLSIFSRDSDFVRGFWKGELETKGNPSMDLVSFQLPNYPDITGEFVLRGGPSRWSEIVLEYDGWCIRLQPHQDFFDLQRKSKMSRTVVLNGLGEIYKGNRSEFTSESLKPVLRALRFFLSFALAEWTSPSFVVGTQTGEIKWHLFCNYDYRYQGIPDGWLDFNCGENLSQAFPGFMKLWMEEGWREPLELAIIWLIESSRMSGGIDGAVVFGQIPLEMLGWTFLVDHSKKVSSTKFKSLSASKVIRSLLLEFGIPPEIPSSLPALESIGYVLGWDGPELITKVRNTIIHPSEKNRKLLTEWENSNSVKSRDIRWESQQLFRWYLTMCLLRVIGFNHNYTCRLNPKDSGKIQPVPWLNIQNLPAAIV